MRLIKVEGGGAVTNSWKDVTHINYHKFLETDTKQFLENGIK